MSIKVIRNSANESTPIAAWSRGRSVEKELAEIRDYNLNIDGLWNITPETEIKFHQGEFGGTLTIVPNEVNLPIGNYLYELHMEGVDDTLTGEYSDDGIKFSLSKY